MRARRARAVAVLFGLSVLLAACDQGDVKEVVADIFGGAPSAAAAEDAADDAASDDATDESGDAASDAADAVSDDASEVASDEPDARCINLNEHVANLRNPPRADTGGRAGGAAGEDTSADRDDDRKPADEPEARDRPERRPDRQPQGDGGGSSEGDGGGSSEGAGQAGGGGSSEGGGQSGGGQSSGLSSIEQDVFDLLNAERRQAGLAPLELDAALTRGARQWSRRMGTEDFFEHDTSGNFAENIAWGYPDAAAVHAGWMDSAGHRRNRMNAGYSSYGVGVHREGDTLYFTERFQ